MSTIRITKHLVGSFDSIDKELVFYGFGWGRFCFGVLVMRKARR